MKYLIVGLGRSGLAAQKFLLALGIPAADIRTFEDAAGTADYSDPQKALAEFKPGTLVVSPGYPLAKPWLRAARAAGVALTSELSLATKALAGEKLIGVTGSVGKSTTVALLYEGARSFDPNAFIGGNFGIPFCEYATAVLKGDRPRAQWIILELSSFQLENCDGLKLDFGAITSFTSNHLERYDSKDDYYKTKWHLADISKSPLYLNAASPELVTYASGRNAQLVRRQDGVLSLLKLHESRLLGTHNQDNFALAATLALAAKWPPSSIKAMKKFGGLSHRLEDAGEFGGVRFINDSKATAMDSVLIAVQSCLESLPAQNNLYVLLGGKDKNLPWEELRALGKDVRTKPVFFGQCGELAKQKSGLTGSVFKSLGEAVTESKKRAHAGDIVLLSPGGTSLDEFKNFEDRGNSFKNYVAK